VSNRHRADRRSAAQKKQARACWLSIGLAASTATNAATQTKLPADAGDSVDGVEIAQAPVAASIVEEVIVNAVRSEALALQEVPESVSAVTGEELARFETNSFQNILTRIGNVRWAGASSQRHPLHTSLTIRGLGYFKSGAGGLDPGVGVSVDGISYAYSTLAAGASFYDLESVQVQRGPQGTLGGLNANLGNIAFVTKAPSFEDEAETSVTYGERDTLILKAAAGGALIENLLAWRATLFRETADGAFENDYNKTQSFGNRDRTIGKLQFLLTPGDNFRARVGLDFTPKGGELDGGTSFGLWARPTPQFYDTLNAQGQPIAVDPTTTPEGRLARRWFQQQSSYQYLDGDRVNISGTYPIHNRQRGAFADLSAEIGGGTLSSLTSWRDLFFYWNGKGTEDRTIFDVVAIPTAADQSFRQFSQELRFNAKVGDVEYGVGAYYLDKSLVAGSMNRFGSDAGAYYANNTQYTALDADSDGRALLLNSADRLLLRSPARTDGESAALFGNVKWDVSDALSVATGLRISDERRTQTASRIIEDDGFGAELNPASVNNVQLNGFNSHASDVRDASGNVIARAGDLRDGNSAEQLALADFVADKYFGVARYADLSANQRRQVAYAKAIRLARLGALSRATKAEAFDEVLIGGHLSPSYRFNETYTAYLSYQHGEKAGVAQLVGATVNGGVSVPVDKEKTDAYEVGLKSLFLGGSLAVNTSLFWQDIDDYIQPLYFYDEAQTVIQRRRGLHRGPRQRAQGALERHRARRELRLRQHRGAFRGRVYRCALREVHQSRQAAGTRRHQHAVLRRQRAPAAGRRETHVQPLARSHASGARQQGAARRRQLQLHRQQPHRADALALLQAGRLRAHRCAGRPRPAGSQVRSQRDRAQRLRRRLRQRLQLELLRAERTALGRRELHEPVPLASRLESAGHEKGTVTRVTVPFLFAPGFDRMRTGTRCAFPRRLSSPGRSPPSDHSRPPPLGRAGRRSCRRRARASARSRRG
jgi:iron complex outermembrane receptor protein